MKYYIITNFHQPISNVSMYQKGILNMAFKTYINLPSFIKRTLDNSYEFISLLRNFFNNNPFYTMDEYFNHNTSWCLYKYLWNSFILYTHFYCNYNGDCGGTVVKVLRYKS